MKLPPLPIAVFVVDAGAKVISWNKSCEALAGYGAAEIRNHPLTQLIHLEGVDGVPPGVWLHSDLDLMGFLNCKNGKKLAVRVTIALHELGTDGPASYSVIIIPAGRTDAQHSSLIEDLPVADIIEGLPCIFYVIDQSAHLLLWNRMLEAALETPGSELPSIEVTKFFDERERDTVVAQMMAAFDTGSSSHEAVLVGKHGKRTHCLFNCERTSIGSIPCVFGTGLDIAAIKRAETGLLVRERAMYSSVNAIVITCRKGGDNLIEYVNPAFELITGYTQDEVKGRNPRFMRVENCDVEEHERIRQALQRCESVRSVLRNARKNGEIFWNELRIDPVLSADGEVTHFVGVINDITEAKHYERRLQHLANHDPLTGLANRTLLHERLETAIAFAQRDNALGALAFLDLDNFKYINDSFGHDTGDIVLKEISSRLSQNVRQEDTVARVGGDEFVLVINDQPGVEDIVDLMERIRSAVSSPVDAAGKEIVPGVSIGVSLFPADGHTADQVMRAADAAMYHAKALGKNNCQFYSPELNRLVHEHLQLEESLRAAIQTGQLYLGYQPKVDLRTGRVIGAEALVRWNHPDSGIMMPDKFIPIAEETGLIVPLGEWVLGTACATLSALGELGFGDFVISVNLSARQLRHRQFAQRLKEMLARHQVAGHQLELEVTESQLMEKPAEAVAALAQLKELGVQLSIDDFGTGYSSLSHLQKFPVDFIKIDRSFLKDIRTNGNTVITRAIIALGHNLKLKVIAEGVETRDQLSFLREHDCDQMQGFYFSAALSQEALRNMVCGNVRLHG